MRENDHGILDLKKNSIDGLCQNKVTNMNHQLQDRNSFYFPNFGHQNGGKHK